MTRAPRPATARSVVGKTVHAAGRVIDVPPGRSVARSASASASESTSTAVGTGRSAWSGSDDSLPAVVGPDSTRNPPLRQPAPPRPEDLGSTTSLPLSPISTPRDDKAGPASDDTPARDMPVIQASWVVLGCFLRSRRVVTDHLAGRLDADQAVARLEAIEHRVAAVRRRHAVVETLVELLGHGRLLTGPVLLLLVLMGIGALFRAAA